MKPASLFTAMILLSIATCQSQVIFEQYEQMKGLLRIGPEPQRQIHLVDKGYTLILPDSTRKPVAILILPDARKVNTTGIGKKEDNIDNAALARNVGVLHITTGNPLDFYFHDSTLHDVASRIESIFEQHLLGTSPLFLAGLSLAGTRALKLAVYLAKNRKFFPGLNTEAVAIVDAPLDMVRFWDAEVRAARIEFHDAAADEGQWVTYLLRQNLGGSPDEKPEAYVRYSPFVHSAQKGGNAMYLRDVPLRAYHEPDVNWWIDNRRKDYYSMNSIDMASLVNELRLQGNTHAELVTTHAKREGFAEGSSPHTWSIVDNAELMGWFLSQLQN